MNIKNFWATQPKTRIAEVAAKAGTTVGYLRQVRIEHRQVSVPLALRLVEASNGLLTLHELRPDVWADPVPAVRPETRNAA